MNFGHFGKCGIPLGIVSFYFPIGFFATFHSFRLRLNGVGFITSYITTVTARTTDSYAALFENLTRRNLYLGGCALRDADLNRVGITEGIKMKTITRIAASILLVSSLSAHALQAARKSPEPVAHPVVNINTATEAQLRLLPGVGPKLANEIYTYAEAGPFLYDPKAPVYASCDHKCHIKSIDDLLKVKGIGKTNLATMRPYVVLSGKTTANAKIKVVKP